MTDVSSQCPPWLRVRIRNGKEYEEIQHLLRGLNLHTVCEEAGCPNIGECFGQRTATFLILGDTCTRNCRFCAIGHGQPGPLDETEPENVAEAVERLGLKFAVITSVTRDDLPDGGAHVYATCMAAIRRRMPECGIEVLIPDFQGSKEALRTVMEAQPDVLNHNVETVPRLYLQVRPQAEYQRSLEVIRRAKEMLPDVLTKSGLMLGLGEEREEVVAVMHDLREVGCSLLTIGQYLRPSSGHLPIQRHWKPDEFRELAEIGQEMGFLHVEAAPLVRSSYHARLQANMAKESHR
ncbi:MAG: lipoyl synthase [Anaerolineae bacterium]|nr:lipoyl synthase [Anaerolineae bacterium]